MGGQISKMMGKIFGSKEMRLLMLGLDAAGKTSELLLTGRLEGSVVEWSHARHLRASPAQFRPALCSWTTTNTTALPSNPLQAQT
jgi:ADP-ribosylation factor family